MTREEGRQYFQSLSDFTHTDYSDFKLLTVREDQRGSSSLTACPGRSAAPG